MSGKVPRTLAGLRDLPGNAGKTNVMGSPDATAAATFDRWGAEHFRHGGVTHEVCDPAERRNRMTSARTCSAIETVRESFAEGARAKSATASGDPSWH